MICLSTSYAPAPILDYLSHRGLALMFYVFASLKIFFIYFLTDLLCARFLCQSVFYLFFKLVHFALVLLNMIFNADARMMNLQKVVKQDLLN